MSHGPTPEQYAALERSHDGPIPAHLLNPKTEAEYMADHHRAMIRFSQVRVADFTASLEKLRTRPDSDPTKAGWISRTVGIINEHKRDIARHEAELAALTAPVLSEAAE